MTDTPHLLPLGGINASLCSTPASVVSTFVEPQRRCKRWESTGNQCQWNSEKTMSAERKSDRRTLLARNFAKPKLLAHFGGQPAAIASTTHDDQDSHKFSHNLDSHLKQSSHPLRTSQTSNPPIWRTRRAISSICTYSKSLPHHRPYCSQTLGKNCAAHLVS